MAAVTSALQPGFVDQTLAAQSTFRAVMEAMARPGRPQRVDVEVGRPSSLMPGAAAIALTLFDHDTPVWLDPILSSAPDVGAWLKFHTGAPMVADLALASFALVAEPGALPDLDSFALGSAEYPDRSTTLIMQVPSLSSGETYRLRGPGIDRTISLRATIAPADLFERLSINERLFPRGIDVVLIDGTSVVAIPRTARLVAAGV
ncbi:phosphonate C-P lyase system protein PhnH [Bradyrhizobium ontarionense]|uniref:Phosphonate C-P lyase system protein PhnH n=1 Tax=Bradyrhizobium ontarionense TaxID=2898149 RepID=A0ABY3RBW2_9BRAD|nr:phosphonate C-P lyase system protein PhnH [Bradyrhizobium sp. A19]UFZ04252.1 phosphonate C-P lyase system protein PhnH [Bradyrhizobium sp. A19]